MPDPKPDEKLQELDSSIELREMEESPASSAFELSRKAHTKSDETLHSSGKGKKDKPPHAKKKSYGWLLLLLFVGVYIFSSQLNLIHMLL